jgi:hypothetical protein
MTATARPALHLDQLQAVRTTVVNLAREFDGTHDPEAIERLLISVVNKENTWANCLTRARPGPRRSGTSSPGTRTGACCRW